MEIIIDKNSGFCFGVVSAINCAEQELAKDNNLYCLGEIVHNSLEVARLENEGLEIISEKDFDTLNNVKVLIRAHGEPPQTYQKAAKQNITLVDATCPIVLRLQKNVEKGYNEMLDKKGHVVIYGTKGHAEVIGLEGQAENTALVVSSIEDLDLLDFSKPIRLYSQTTKNKEDYQQLIEEIQKRLPQNADFVYYNTICGQVANRASDIKEFAKQMDILIFVSGKNSSNGKYLYSLCKQVQPNSYFVSSVEELNAEWFTNDVQKVGIAGATSTPMWLMEKVKEHIQQNISQQ